MLIIHLQNLWKSFSIVCLLFFLNVGLLAQDTSRTAKVFETDATDMLKLMNQKNQDEDLVSITGYKETPLRESPGIVTLITEEEIKNSGARDLVDILRLVPGLNFAHNYENAIGFVARGNWAEEGKFLLLLDGMILNENSFGTVAFGQRIPIGNIKRIEIIRGAGSSIYGGLAELCVINIITKTTTSKSGAEVKMTSGISEGRFSRNNFLVDVFQSYKDDSRFSISAFATKGTQSNIRFTDLQGRNINYGDSSETATQNINMGLIKKDFQFNFIFNNYEYENLNNLKVGFRDYMANIAYNWHISKKLSLKPRVSWKNLQPWNYQNYQNLPSANQAIYDGYRTNNNRYTASIVSLYTPNDNMNITIGGEFFSENATYQVKGLTFSNNKNRINFSNIAFFGEVLYKSRFANITAGVRYDDYSAVEPAIVPRIAVTRALEKWHFKALYSASFKAPTIQNIEFSIENDIQPERTNSIELEIGYKLNNNTSITANIFDIRIQKPIVYFIDRITFSEGYTNLNQTGSQGFEVEFKTKPKWGLIQFGYSYYTPQYNETPNYQVIDANGNVDKTIYLGVPNHKLTLNTHLKVNNKFYFNPMMMYFSKKYTYLFNNNLDLVLTEFKPEFHVNLSAYFVANDQLKINFGIYNLLGQNLWFINPYNSGDNPIPEHKQEILLQISYRLSR
ncbi:hypothetical protein AD998_09645 [bacterium 336/3]|nr:hypothetical protein AD998_09645 [bacterium 336/3]